MEKNGGQEITLRISGRKRQNPYDYENLKADFFTKNGWTVNKIKIAEEVNIRYYPEKYPWYKPSPIVYTDYATFYCSVGGTIEQEFNIADFTPSESSLTGEESVETAEDIFPEENPLLYPVKWRLILEDW